MNQNIPIEKESDIVGDVQVVSCVCHGGLVLLTQVDPKGSRGGIGQVDKPTNPNG